MSDQVMVPEFPTVRIGKRKATQKVIEILPLSWHDAKKLQDTFVKLIQTCGAMVMEKKPEADIYRFVFVALCDSVETILPYITDVEVDPKEITIEQVIEIAKITYEQNFEIISKNAVSLLQNLGVKKTEVAEQL